MQKVEAFEKKCREYLNRVFPPKDTAIICLGEEKILKMGKHLTTHRVYVSYLNSCLWSNQRLKSGSDHALKCGERSAFAYQCWKLQLTVKVAWSSCWTLPHHWRGQCRYHSCAETPEDAYWASWASGTSFVCETRRCVISNRLYVQESQYCIRATDGDCGHDSLFFKTAFRCKRISGKSVSPETCILFPKR